MVGKRLAVSSLPLSSISRTSIYGVVANSSFGNAKFRCYFHASLSVRQACINIPINCWLILRMKLYVIRIHGFYHVARAFPPTHFTLHIVFKGSDVR
jgi:hypothetical protein